MANKEKHHPEIHTVSIGGATFDLFLTMGPELTVRDGEVLLKVGDKLPVKQVIESTGGGACNTAVGFARLGFRASFCGIVGSDQWGEKLLKTLTAEGVDVSPATIVENETSSFSIILTLPGGDRTILYTPGANEHLDHATFDLETLKHADAVFLNHLSGNSSALENDIIKTLVDNPKIWLSWNPGGPQIRNGMRSGDEAALLKVTNLLLLNKEEAIGFTGRKNITEALAALLKAGARNVCITDGQNGVTASDGQHIYSCPILPVRIIETTGAGDAFGTGASYALLTGDGLPEALVAGTLNSASVVGTVGAEAGLLTETQIRERMLDRPLTVETIS